MTADEWVVISSKEYDQLQSRIKQYERFIQGQPAIAQELFELRQQVRDAEAAHAAILAEVSRLQETHAARSGAAAAGASGLLLARLIKLLIAQFVTERTGVRLQKCLVCERVSADQGTPELHSHRGDCPVRSILLEWQATRLSTADIGH